MRKTPYEQVPEAIREAAEQLIGQALIERHSPAQVSAAWEASVAPLIEEENQRIEADRIARIEARRQHLAEERERLFGGDDGGRVEVELLRPLTILEERHQMGERLSVSWRFAEKLCTVRSARRVA